MTWEEFKTEVERQMAEQGIENDVSIFRIDVSFLFVDSIHVSYGDLLGIEIN